MSRKERSIKIAFDKSSGEILEADKVFDITKNAFEVRRKYHEGNLKLSCCECNQDLVVSGSLYDRLHFKHKPGHDNCILSKGVLSPHDHEIFTNILIGKESERHKFLKRRIGDLLSSVEGIDISSIAIDSKFIVRGTEKRRPDVYCKYYDKELVFEIQLSNLSLGYILNRYEFYKIHGMYLIWILDKFDHYNQGTLERDIKYLTKYENFFKLDEKSDTFKLECDFKIPFLTNSNKLHTKWKNKSVSLSQISFDSENYQIYFYNLDENFKNIEIEQQKRLEELEEKEKKRIQKERLEYAKHLSNHLISEIKRLRKNKAINFNSIINQINDLDTFQVEILNTELRLSSRLKENKPPLVYWIENATPDDLPFLEFILECNAIIIDPNFNSENGKTAFQSVIENTNITSYYLIKSLFKAGYNLTPTDKDLLLRFNEQNSISNEDYLIYLFCNKLQNRELVEDVFIHRKLIFIIESALQRQIIGFNYKANEWIAFANNAIQHHSAYWEYIELAFKYYGIWDSLIKLDKKSSFQKKLIEFYSKMPEQKYDFDEVFKDLFPDLGISD